MRQCFFFNDTATTEIYTLSLHDALPICLSGDDLMQHMEMGSHQIKRGKVTNTLIEVGRAAQVGEKKGQARDLEDRKSTRLNSSHANISYAVFCLKKKNTRTVLTRAHILT